MLENLGRLLIVVGGGLLIVGLVFLVLGRGLGLGRLPGDIVIERENFRLFLPLGTMLVVSLLATLVLSILSRLGR